MIKRRTKVLLLSIGLLLASVAYIGYAKGLFKSYQQKVVSDQPLLLKNDDVLTMTDMHYIQRNNIIVRDRAKLVVTDSLFEHRQEYASQYRLEARDQAEVIFVNSHIRSSAWLNWNFTDSARLKMDNTEQMFSDIWLNFSGAAQAATNRARFHGTVGGQAQINIENSPDTFLEFVYPAHAIVAEELPKRITDYVFPNTDDRNIGFTVAIKNSVTPNWGITVNPASHVTIRNTDALTVTVAFGEPLEETTVTLDGLQAAHYQDQTWQAADITLRLENVTTNRWSPIVGGTNTLIVKNSELADNAFSWGSAKLIIENSSLSFVRAKDRVDITLRNSSVAGDVVAVDQGVVHLINTTVRGKQQTEDMGRIRPHND